MAYIIYKCKKRLCRQVFYTKEHAEIHFDLTQRRGKAHFQFEMIFVMQDKDLDKFYFKGDDNDGKKKN